MYNVTYRQNGKDKTAKENLTHHEACMLASAMEREGFKHVSIVRVDK